MGCRSAQVAEKQQKLEAMKGEVPQAARDAAAKAGRCLELSSG